ncbi:MAG: hypothetical protein JWP57_4234 [Spirosoma sp.]|nr:hypothetical protein [Spirosoma sp.]
MNTKTAIRSLRMISSFALLGAVLVGTIFGWGDNAADVARSWGALGGAAVGTVTTLKFLHFI